MQLLVLPGTAAGTQPVYLPYDKAPVPFGDPLAATITSAASAVVTVPGYTPTLNDAVSITIQGTNGLLTTQSGLAGFVQVSTTYFVTPAGGQSFTLSTQKSTTAITTQASLTTLGQAGGIPIVHLLSAQVDGTTLPFKPNNTVLAMNLGVAAGPAGAITLFSAPDKTTVYGNPLGASAYSVIATIAVGTPQLITINNDWVVASGSTASLSLLQY